MTANILICAYPGARQRFAKVFDNHYLSFADTLEEARAVLDSRNFDLILIGTRFDESRMFDLLRHLHAGGKSGNTSIVCFRGMMSVPASDLAIVEGLSLACEVLGARAFYDFAIYPDDATGNAAIRRIITSHLPPAGLQRQTAGRQ
ncbi:MAG: hypothetical protein ACT4PS_14675 [Betaproteobacteria bacterium]